MHEVRFESTYTWVVVYSGINFYFFYIYINILILLINYLMNQNKVGGAEKDTWRGKIS